MFNSKANSFPLLLLAGSCETYLVGKESFQEQDAISLLREHVKFAIRPHQVQAIPSAIRNAYRVSQSGRPGTGFVDLPADYLQSTVPTAFLSLPLQFSDHGAPSGDAATVKKIAQALKEASAPLLVIGKGAAYARAEDVVRKFVDSTRVPFLPTPMGKGVVPDSHPYNASSARSTALKSADVVICLGARLNWILHFGQAPKWNANARIIQVDIDADVIGQNGGDMELSIVADINSFMQQLLSQLGSWRYSVDTAFAEQLSIAKASNKAKLAKMAQIQSMPLTFEHAYYVIRSTIDALSPPSDGGVCYVMEGARTMDTSRSWFYQDHPRLRLDAGTLGTMGIGFGYAVAAWEAYNGLRAEASSGKRARKKIVCIIGDSATGFSGMEIETMARYGMDCLMFVMNNGGVYHGHADGQEEWLRQQQASKQGRGNEGLRSWSLGWETRYDMFADAVGGKGYLVRTSEELKQATLEGFEAKVWSIAESCSLRCQSTAKCIDRYLSSLMY